MKTIVSEKAPKAVGPYSQAVRTGNLIYCSGQIPLDPETGKIVGSNIEEQAQRVIDNIKLLLGGAGLGLNNIVKTTVFLTDLGNFQGMNKIYSAAFGDHKPARSTIGVKQLPMDALVEIECIVEASA